MCGIAGFLDPAGKIEEPIATLRSMAGAIAHRGPDGSGEWLDADSRVGLAHRRLAIVDLSEEGSQPMTSDCGRYVIAFNGEVYNYPELRTELDGAGAATRWRGHSDTEVVLAAIRFWGLVDALRKFNGMFAMAVYDKSRRVLHLARDRFGEKPCYYGWNRSRFLFASELKALEAAPGWVGQIDRVSTGLFLKYCYVPTPLSIYSGIRKLPPASFVSIGTDQAVGQDLEPTKYWSPTDSALKSVHARVAVPDEEALRLVDTELRRAVALRMRADVPLGAFLSGGIDSSLIVSIMQAESARPVKTFTIGVDDRLLDESSHARAVAAWLGTEHTEYRVTPQSMMQVVPTLPNVYDEPFADSSQIPTIIVSRLARERVTVALSGDGGDELFGGYTRHVWAKRLQLVRKLPGPVRGFIVRLLERPGVGFWDAVAASVAATTGRQPIQLLGHKVRKLARGISAADVHELYELLVTVGDQLPESRGLTARKSGVSSEVNAIATLSLAEQMMHSDTTGYLVDDILVKVDRATMSASLEGRVPFLDPNLFELAWRLPESVRVRGREGKWALRQLLYRYVSRSIVDRPKAGFALPIGAWLRGPLREWAESHLSESALGRSGLVDTPRIRDVWKRHLGGSAEEQRLWAVLMLQTWLEARLGIVR